ARARQLGGAAVFADEPTGALDSATAAEVLGLLGTVVRGGGRTVVMVTHDPLAAAHADRVVFLADGRIAGELRQPSAAAVAERMTRLTGRGRAATPPTAAQAGPAWGWVSWPGGPSATRGPASPHRSPRWPRRRWWAPCGAGCWKPGCARTCRRSACSRRRSW